MTAPARKPQSATASVIAVAMRSAQSPAVGAEADQLEIAQLLHGPASLRVVRECAAQRHRDGRPPRLKLGGLA